MSEDELDREQLQDLLTRLDELIARAAGLAAEFPDLAPKVAPDADPDIYALRRCVLAALDGRGAIRVKVKRVE